MTFGARLKEERTRLGLTQALFGAHGGVVKFTQFNYEKDVASPSVEYLYKLEKLGVDIGFLVTGQRTMPASIKHDELDQRTAGLVRRWAQLGEPAKNLVETTVQLLPVVESTNIKPTA